MTIFSYQRFLLGQKLSFIKNYITTYKRFFIILALVAFTLSLPIALSLLNEQSKQKTQEPVFTIASSCSPGQRCPGIDLTGSDLPISPYTSGLSACESYCDQNPNCVAWTWVEGLNPEDHQCWMKGSVPAENSCNNCTSGIKSCLKIIHHIQCNSTPGCFYRIDSRCVEGAPGQECGAGYCNAGQACTTLSHQDSTPFCAGKLPNSGLCKHGDTGQPNNDACVSGYCNPNTFTCADKPEGGGSGQVCTPGSATQCDGGTVCTLDGKGCCPLPYKYACSGTCSETPCDGSGSGGTTLTLNKPVPLLGSATCSDQNYKTLLSWTGSGQGWWVDISTDSSFSGWSNREVSGFTSVMAPDGFSQGLALVPGVTYHWRIWNGSSHTPGPKWIVPKCSGTGGGITPAATSTPTPTKTPTPTPTKTPTPTPTVRPPTATSTPTSTVTQAPTTSPTAGPTATTVPGGTSVALSLWLDGIGPNSAAGENNNPQPNLRSVSITVHDSSGNQVSNGSANLTFDQASSSFKGNASLTVASGIYRIKVRFDNTLWKAINGVSLSANQTTTLPTTKLVTGDINGDNQLNLIDYNSVISCYGGKACLYKTQSDLNMDGKVDELDLNILYVGFSKRVGD